MKLYLEVHDDSNEQVISVQITATGKTMAATLRALADDLDTPLTHVDPQDLPQPIKAGPGWSSTMYATNFEPIDPTDFDKIVSGQHRLHSTTPKTD